MIHSLGQRLLHEKLLATDDRVVVGVSGGADSVALLHLLAGLNKEFNWNLHLVAAHLNHQTRGVESDADEAHVQALASKLSVPCIAERRDVPGAASSSAISLEEAGRRERYAFFERVCLRTNCNIVAVAHHADDQAETILHRILRGTGLRGLSGIPSRRPLQPNSEIQLIRPLLHITRSELRTYLAEHKIEFREDRSNELTEPTRNWIRIHLMPLLQAEMNPRVRSALVRLGLQADAVRTYADDMAARTFESVIIDRSENRISLSVPGLSKKSVWLQSEVLRFALRLLDSRGQRLSFRHIEELLRLLDPTRSHDHANLPHGVLAERRDQELVITKGESQVDPRVFTEVPVQVPGRTLFPPLGPILDTERLSVIGNFRDYFKADRDAGTELLDSVALSGPLTLRTRRPADRFHPLGAPGSKPLAEFFIDHKIDQTQRDGILILCDQLGPVWVVGHRIADRVKLTSSTRTMLRLTVHK